MMADDGNGIIWARTLLKWKHFKFMKNIVNWAFPPLIVDRMWTFQQCRLCSWWPLIHLFPATLHTCLNTHVSFIPRAVWRAPWESWPGSAKQAVEGSHWETTVTIAASWPRAGSRWHALYVCLGSPWEALLPVWLIFFSGHDHTNRCSFHLRAPQLLIVPIYRLTPWAPARQLTLNTGAAGLLFSRAISSSLTGWMGCLLKRDQCKGSCWVATFFFFGSSPFPACWRENAPSLSLASLPARLRAWRRRGAPKSSAREAAGWRITRWGELLLTAEEISHLLVWFAADNQAHLLWVFP